MKNTITILLLALSPFLSHAQCEIPGGDFEDIQDISSEFVQTGEYDFCENSTLISSPSFVPALRLFFLIFEIYFSGLEADCQQLFGLNQHPGANGTTSALKLQPDTLLNFADVITIFPCDMIPVALKGSYLHVGSALDSANVLIALNYDSNEETSDAIGQLKIEGGSNEFTKFEVPIELINDEIVLDTIAIALIASSDSTFLAEGNEAYYVFDELELVYDEDPLSVFDNEIYNQLSISPNPAVDRVNISLADYSIHNIKVYNESGKLMLEQNAAALFNTEIDVSQLPNGLYVINVTGHNFALTKKLIKI